MKYLENTLDLDSFGHVSLKMPQQLEVGTFSAGTSQQSTQKYNTSITRTSKGKEVETTKQPIMTKQPKWKSKRQEFCWDRCLNMPTSLYIF